MNVFLWILVLALAWCAVNGSFDGRQLAVGTALGSLILLFVGVARVTYIRRAWRVVNLIGIFLVELVVANFRVARDVMLPHSQLSPGVVAIPLYVESDLEITLLANLISLTPGTLTLDISQDRKTLYVHSMWADDPGALRKSVKDTFERRIRECSQ
jgi:multicomponent Na+:H+ antiporter subunit E